MKVNVTVDSVLDIGQLLGNLGGHPCRTKYQYFPPIFNPPFRLVPGSTASPSQVMLVKV
jgi:hypothetical protein